MDLSVRFPWRILSTGLVIATTTLLAGCGPAIWNAGDLAAWVRNEAVKQGCEQPTIELDEWYVQTPAGNVWHGNCKNATGLPKSLAINVDRVWTPSATD